MVDRYQDVPHNNNGKVARLSLKYDQTDPPVCIHRGAGVIVFSIDPCDGRIFFLLSRERRWQSCTKFVLSGFEGRSKPGEVPMETAAREFAEESLGVVTEMPHREAAMDTLGGSQYLCKIRMVVETDNMEKMAYTSFVKQIKYDPSIPKRFSNLRRRLRCLRAISNINDPRLRSFESLKFFRDHPDIGDFPGLVNKSTDQIGGIVEAHVNPDFLEKDSVSFIQDCHVEKHLKNSSSRMKPYIRPAMLIALREVQAFARGVTPLREAVIDIPS